MEGEGESKQIVDTNELDSIMCAALKKATAAVKRPEALALPAPRHHRFPSRQRRYHHHRFALLSVLHTQTHTHARTHVHTFRQTHRHTDTQTLSSLLRVTTVTLLSVFISI